MGHKRRRTVGRKKEIEQMAIYKRGGVYWYEFVWDGQRIQRSTRTGNQKAAINIEAAERLRLAEERGGIKKKKKKKEVPTLAAFAPRFKDHIQLRCAEKPQTIRFYKSKLDRLLEFPLLATARLDKITEELIERYVAARIEKDLRPASVNRELATLRRMLYLAKRWNIIATVPTIAMLAGEHERTFVLSQEMEPHYLEFAPEHLRDAAIMLLDTGLRVGELCSLLWSDVHLEPIGAARLGYLQVRSGKSKNARRAVSLTSRAAAMLEARLRIGPRVFEVSESALQHQHQKLRDKLGLDREFVLHSLRHTMLTRLGEAGVDAFTIKRIAGHSSITVSERYVHPSTDAMERAFERLENRVPTNLPTVAKPEYGETAVTAVQ
jgi:integrase